MRRVGLSPATDAADLGRASLAPTKPGHSPIPVPAPIRRAGLAPTKPGHTVWCGGMEFDRVAFSQTDAARMLGISRQYFAAKAAAGEIRVVRLGGRRVLVPIDEIVRLLGGQP